MGGEVGASQSPSLAEKKSEVWEKAQEVVKSMIQVEAEFQKKLENKKDKELRLDEVKCLENNRKQSETRLEGLQMLSKRKRHSRTFSIAC